MVLVSSWVLMRSRLMFWSLGQCLFSWMLSELHAILDCVCASTIISFRSETRGAWFWWPDSYQHGSYLCSFLIIITTCSVVVFIGKCVINSCSFLDYQNNVLKLGSALCCKLKLPFTIFFGYFRRRLLIAETNSYVKLEVARVEVIITF